MSVADRPSGLVLSDGCYQLGDQLAGGDWFGLFSGRDLRSDESVIVALAMRQDVTAARATHEWEASGVAPLLEIGEVDLPGLGPFTYLVEAARGRSLGDIAVLGPADCFEALHAMLDLAVLLEGQGVAVGTWQPETLWWVERGTGRALEATPRGVPFLQAARQGDHGRGPLFPVEYFAPEVLRTNAGAPNSGVFVIATMVALWTSGEHPFARRSRLERILAVAKGLARLDAVPDHLRPILAEALNPDPAARPTAEAFRRRLAGELDASDFAWPPSQAENGPK